MSPPEDEKLGRTVELVRAANSGDRDALNALFERYYPRVVQIVALLSGRRVRDLASQEDLVQESMIKAFRGLDKFEERSEGSFRWWISKIVLNALRDTERRRQAAVRGGGQVRVFADVGAEGLHSSILAGAEPSPSAIAVGREAEERLERALLKLPENQRVVWVLRRVSGLSYEEIAAELGIAKGAARERMSAAKKTLKDEFGID